MTSQASFTIPHLGYTVSINLNGSDPPLYETLLQMMAAVDLVRKQVELAVKRGATDVALPTELTMNRSQVIVPDMEEINDILNFQRRVQDSSN